MKNQPANTILFGWVRGDDFTVTDSARLSQPEGILRFNFPADAHPGVYRVVFGTTAYARITNGQPQQLDFIFDNENIVLATDFKEPFNQLEIIDSKENTAWFGFLWKDQVLKEEIEKFAKQVDQYWEKNDKEKLVETANRYNQLQMERDAFILKSVQETRGLFASQMIRNQRMPLLDGFLTPEERKQAFKKEYFKSVDFGNESLIYTQVYTDNVFNYLTSYNNPMFTQKQRETEYIKALDIVVPNIRQNEQVYRFLMDYLVHGFTVLKMDGVLNHISRKYNYPQ